MHDHAGAEGEGEEIGDGVGRWKIERGIFSVGGKVKGVLCGEDTRNVVTLGIPVVWLICGDGKVR
jgi:hypothetical protein